MSDKCSDTNSLKRSQLDTYNGSVDGLSSVLMPGWSGARFWSRTLREP